MSNKNLRPILRFYDFKYTEWIPLKLENVVRFSKGKGYSKNDLLENGSPIILYGRMYTNYETIIREVDTYTNPQKNTVYSNGTEVIVPSSGETAEDIARASYVSQKGIILAGDLNIMHLTEEHSPLFLTLSISNGDRKKELIKRVQGSSVVHLYNTDLRNVIVYFPELSEQNKIGLFFEKIDKMIQLQQSKVNKVKNIKSAYLSEMFPKEGEKYPKKRFEGFNHAWVSTTFGEFLKTEPFKKYLAKEDRDGIYPVIQQGDNPIDGYANGTPYKNYDSVILFGDHTLSLYKPERYFLIASDGIKILNNNSINRNYLYYLLERYMPESEGYKRHYSILKNKVAYMTNNKKEQRKIGEFLKNLDNQISTEEEKLMKLEKLKQAYLNDMFV